MEPIISALGKQGQEDEGYPQLQTEFKAGVGYMRSYIKGLKKIKIIIINIQLKA